MRRCAYLSSSSPPMRSMCGGGSQGYGEDTISTPGTAGAGGNWGGVWGSAMPEARSSAEWEAYELVNPRRRSPRVGARALAVEEVAGCSSWMRRRPCWRMR
jgi:hypothetical protein